MFPVSAGNSIVRPDTTDDDTDAGRSVLSDRAGFIRVVLGGWMDSLAQEEGKNGSHGQSNCTRAGYAELM
mgnify:FL=1